MTELKILKDFVGFDTEGNLGIGKKYIDREELKAEAIKWVKEMIKTSEEGLALDWAPNYFKTFFNITSEDLKS